MEEEDRMRQLKDLKILKREREKLSMIIYVVVLNVIYALECCLFVSLCHTGLWWREHGDSLNPFVKDLNRCFLSLP